MIGKHTKDAQDLAPGDRLVPSGEVVETVARAGHILAVTMVSGATRNWRVLDQIEALDPMSAGAAALEELLSHDPDLLVVSESHGTGLVTAEAHASLVRLLKTIQDAHVILALDVNDTVAVEACLNVASDGADDGNELARRGYEIASALGATINGRTPK